VLLVIWEGHVRPVLLFGGDSDRRFIRSEVSGRARARGPARRLLGVGGHASRAR